MPRARSTSAGLLPCRWLVVTAMVVLGLLAPAARAQAGGCESYWLPGQGSIGTDGYVNDTLVLPNGDVIVGGSFTVAGTVIASNIARYSPGTGLWSALGSGVSGGDGIDCLALLPNGDIVAGGSFTAAGGAAANRIAKYNPTTGVWSPMGAGTSGAVLALAALPNGDVVAGGEFTQAGNLSASRIARWNSATSAWSPIGVGLNNTVRALVALQDGQVLITGHFTAVAGVASNYIAKVNPITGTWGALGTGLNGPGFALALASNGDAIVGGEFTAVSGVPAGRVARYTPSVGAWQRVGSAPNATVRALAVTPGGDIIAGGDFTIYAGAPASRIARFNAVSQTWSALGSGADQSVLTISVLPDGRVFCGGYFTGAGGIPLNGVAAFDATNGLWSATGTGTNWYVNSLVPSPNGDIIAGGAFTGIDSVSANRVARYDVTSGVWSSLGGGVAPSVQAVAVVPNGDVVVCSSDVSNPVNRFDHASHLWSSLGTTRGYTYTLASLPDGDVLVGGQSLGPSGAWSLARIDLPSNTWTGPGNLSGPAVYAIAPGPGGIVNVGGDGYFPPSPDYRGGARLNLASNTWSSFGGHFGNGLGLMGARVFLTLPDGDVIIGGYFLGAGGLPANNIVRFHPTTGTLSLMGSGTNLSVSALALLPDGQVIVGGGFTQAGGVVANRIARYNPATNTWHALGSGMNSSVYAITTLPNGEILVGGDFTIVDGRVSAYLAQYHYAGSPPDITAQPQPSSTCPGGSSAFAVGSFSSPSGTVRWQWRLAGDAAWSDIPEGITNDPRRAGATPLFAAAGSTTANLTLTDALTTAATGDVREVRALITNTCGEAPTSATTWVVRPAYDRLCGGPGCDRDLNLDGSVDQDDVRYLIGIIAGDANPARRDPDFNHDGSVDQDDITALIAAIANGACP